MKNEIVECYQRFSNQVSKEMIDPDIFVVDFIPIPLKDWKDKSNLDNFNHTQRIWFKLNKLFNKHLVGRHTERQTKRPFLLHSFNSFETYHKTKKQEWIKIPPHLHSILFVHPEVKDRFQELLEYDSQEQVMGIIENSGVNFSTPFTIRPEVFVGAFGTEIEDSILSFQIRIPYDLEGKVDYSIGLFENYRAIHPENVFKHVLEEKLDGMNVFILPSENDFKRKIMVNPFGEAEEEIVSVGLDAGVS